MLHNDFFAHLNYMNCTCQLCELYMRNIYVNYANCICNSRDILVRNNGSGLYQVAIICAETNLGLSLNLVAIICAGTNLGPSQSYGPAYENPFTVFFLLGQLIKERLYTC